MLYDVYPYAKYYDAVTGGRVTSARTSVETRKQQHWISYSLLLKNNPYGHGAAAMPTRASAQLKAGLS